MNKGDLNNDSENCFLDKKGEKKYFKFDEIFLLSLIENLFIYKFSLYIKNFIFDYFFF